MLPPRRSLSLILVLLLAACGDDDSTATATRTPTAIASATRTETPPPSPTATDRPPATSTATHTATAVPPSPTASDTPTPTASPTLAIPTGTATATVTPTADPLCAGKLGVAGTRELTITSGGLQRTVRLTVPESALRGVPAPLLLLYHGVTSNAAQIVVATGMDAKAAAEGFILAAGNGVGASWNAGACCQPAVGQGIDDVGFTRDLVAALDEEYCIDPARTYASGFSNGAAMVFRLACEASDLIAAFAPVGGSVAIDCAPAQPRPMLVINNVEDPIVPYVLGQISYNAFTQFNGCDATRSESAPASNATCVRAALCEDDAVTELCSVTGTSHVWPGGLVNPMGPFKATDAVWEFLDAAR
jgi:polyhydroxybutyrate depolymerase